MSLNRDEMRKTAEDFQQFLAKAGLSRDDLCTWLGLPSATIDHVIAMDGEADPVDVWFVRDAIDAAMRDVGIAARWSVLTDEARRKGQTWFSLRDIPTRD